MRRSGRVNDAPSHSALRRLWLEALEGQECQRRAGQQGVTSIAGEADARLCSAGTGSYSYTHAPNPFRLAD